MKRNDYIIETKSNYLHRIGDGFSTLYRDKYLESHRMTFKKMLPRAVAKAPSGIILWHQ
jgi:hypothetical protein